MWLVGQTTSAIKADALSLGWDINAFSHSSCQVLVVSAVIVVSGTHAARILVVAFPFPLVAWNAGLPCTLTLGGRRHDG